MPKGTKSGSLYQSRWSAAKGASLLIDNSRPVRKYSSAGGVVIREADGYVLVLLRPGRLGPKGRPEVRLPKGHIEPGESPEQAALREVREEAGLPVPVIVAALGHQRVKFDWQGVHYIRDENYYLMSAAASGELVAP